MKSPLPIPLRCGRARLPGGTLCWRETGQGETIVLLHGTWFDSGQWLDTMQDISSDFHCIAPDLLGFGESEPPQHYTIASQVDCLEALLNQLRIDRCLLVGHSLGAWVAAAYALRQSQPPPVALIAPEGVGATAQRSLWRAHRRRRHSLPGLWQRFWPLPADPAQAAAGDLRAQLRHFPAATQTLFRRPWDAVQAEVLSEEQTLWLKGLVLEPAIAEPSVQGRSERLAPQLVRRQVAAGPLPLGLSAAAIATELRQFSQASKTGKWSGADIPGPQIPADR